MTAKSDKQQGEKNQLGWFGGVFTPAILTILGVIMFMRAGFVVGHGGVVAALTILLVAKSITLTTSFSIAAISTNIQVRGGGSYFLISRVLGVEFGGAIGIALFFALALSVPFYILGFTEAVVRSYPSLSPHFQTITLIAAGVLFMLAYFGAGWAVRAQFLIMFFLFMSIIFFVGGAAQLFSPNMLQENLQPAMHADSSLQTFPYWALFAIYFPAVTGIDAGVNMSGDLKDPGKSIPRGTFYAVGLGFLVYAAQIILLGGAFERGLMIDQPYEVLRDNALFGWKQVVGAGVFAATLSSALGSYLGAPRVLQAISRDRIFNFLRPFARGAVKGDEPRRALFITLGVTLIVLLWAGDASGGGALNVVASLITMFFLYSYGMINLAAFIEGFGDNPSFRPSFRFFHWSIALLGALGCVIVSLLVHWQAALGAMLVLAALFYFIHRRHLTASFGNARRGFIYKSVRDNLLRLRRIPEDSKNWRPNILVFSGNPMAREELIHYGVWLESRRGIVYLANVLVGDMTELIAPRRRALHQLTAFCNEHNHAAFPVVVTAPTVEEGIAMVLQATAVGPINPNLVIFGWSTKHERRYGYINELRTAYALGMSLVMLKHNGMPAPESAKRIDIWWRGRKNGNLMLLLAFLLTENWEWENAEVRLLRVVDQEAGLEPAEDALAQLVGEARVEASVKVVVSDETFTEVLPEHSGDAACVILGFELPEKGEESAWHRDYLAYLSSMPNTVLLVNSRGEEDMLA